GLRFAGVVDRTLHEEPSGEVKEREAACLRLFSHHADHFLDPLGLAALVATPSVHLSGLGAAGAGWRRLDAKPFQEFGQFCAWAVRWWCWHWLRLLKARLGVSWICRVVNVDSPLFAVLRDNAGHHFSKRIATLRAALLQV
ncbi:MAG: hypothetical protein EBR82_88180, partial [Caulobacteraceae bacterium]|nr:hypothetical protein [Caulobacteraceae bacterium]